ncbi:hypothetical protein [Nonomuraea insulae]|uniref:Peptidase inhibitor family I36 n=1 Tax=Nonomuraea insulae TaxID=1616787 RepID=A0ABW1CL39_9ACTN
MSTKRMRTAAAALCVAAAAASALATAAPASAGDSTYKGCRAGNVCLYKGDLSENYLYYQTAGNIPDGKTFWVIVNNGRQQQGADHVRFEYQYYGATKWYSKCLHFYPGSGFKLDLRDGAVNAKIRNMSWGGEC